ncbi:MAG: DUF3943 domain-containing protein [Polyangiaceae bacterium]|jgi:hypothetical protein|nr:DUF3943 domain-containing protein [Polyangiaceae bacterium]
MPPPAIADDASQRPAMVAPAAPLARRSGNAPQAAARGSGLPWLPPEGRSTTTALGASVPSAPAASHDEGPRWGPPIAHSLVLMTGTRLAEAYLYPEPFARVDLGFWGERYRDAFTKPPLFDTSKPAFRWDGDPLVINVVGHGLMGSEYYLRARTCRFSPWGALAFAAGASVVWEYAFEANGVRPSGLDLVYTPLAGLALGEARYQAWRAAAGLSSPGWRAVVRGVVDPFGELERGVRLFSC